MIPFPEVKHRIPQPFHDKIEVDKAIMRVREQAVVSLKQYRGLLAERDHLRYSCAEMVKKQRGGSGMA